MAQDDAPNTPLPPGPPDQPTPEQLGQAVAANEVAARQTAADKAYIESLNIVDPHDPEPEEDQPGAAGEAGEKASSRPAARAPEVEKPVEKQSDLDRRIALLEQIAQQQFRVQQPQQQQVQQPPPAPVFPPPPELPPLEDGSEWEPALKEAWKAQQDHFTGLLQKQHEQLQQVTQSFAQQQQNSEARSYEQQADAFFAKCDEEIYGKGTVHDLDKDSEERQARMKVAKLQQVLEMGYRDIGERPSRASLFEQAHEAIYGKQVADKKMTARERDRRGQYIAAPTARTKSPVEGEGYAFAVKEARKHPFFQE